MVLLWHCSAEKALLEKRHQCITNLYHYRSSLLFYIEAQNQHSCLRIFAVIFPIHREDSLQKAALEKLPNFVLT